MKALVVYDSEFGNTEKVARAMGEALDRLGDVQVLNVTDPQALQVEGLDLLVAGGPTQRFTARPAMKSWLKAIPSNGLARIKVAAFDTRITQEEIDGIKILAFFVKLFGYAAEPIAKGLTAKGGELLVEPAGFYVAGTEGPMVKGELERAEAWAEGLLG